MLNDDCTKHAWTLRQRPLRLERRYAFADYPETRDFLERASVLFEREGVYPDINFGRTYANATLYADEGADEPGTLLHRLAGSMDRLAGAS